MKLIFRGLLFFRITILTQNFMKHFRLTTAEVLKNISNLKTVSCCDELIRRPESVNCFEFLF